MPRAPATAAIGVDRAGRVLFIHSRSPYSVHDLIAQLQKLPIDLARAMYVEGGPEAQLYVRAGHDDLEFIGSYETGFIERDDNDHAWPVPNVVVVVPRRLHH
ncbi:MAG TPA: phosphodiester glycosidase family protein [Thermoanaerobaculia bacterium]|nr:phosphodiester glycosidase family protein [Thermoanaerobaculia bacterium]